MYPRPVLVRVNPRRRELARRERAGREDLRPSRVATVVALLVATAAAPASAAPATGTAPTDPRSYSGAAAVPAPPGDIAPTPAHAAELPPTPPPKNPPPQDESADEEGAWDDEGESEDGDDEAWDDDYDPLRDSPEAIAAQRRIVGGGVLMLVGGATVVGAVAMGLSDPCARPAGNSCSPASRNRAAVTMGLPGGAILVAGAVVFGLARRARSQIRLDASVSVRQGALVSVSYTHLTLPTTPYV